MRRWLLIITVCTASLLLGSSASTLGHQPAAAEAETASGDQWVKTRFSTATSRIRPGLDNQGYVYFDTDGFWRGRDLSAYEVGWGDDCDHYYWGASNFFSFDLSGLEPGSARRATLVLRRGVTSFGGTYQLNQVSTPAHELYLGEPWDFHRDLNDGAVYGRHTVTDSAESDSWLRLRLNRAAVADINAAAGGWFSVGGSLTASPGPTCGRHTLFSLTGNKGPQRLVIRSVPSTG